MNDRHSSIDSIPSFPVFRIVGNAYPVRSAVVYRDADVPNLFLAFVTYVPAYSESPRLVVTGGYDREETLERAFLEAYKRYVCSKPPVDGSVITGNIFDLNSPFLDPRGYFPLSRKNAKIAGLKPFSERRRLRWVRVFSSSVSIPPQFAPLDMVYYDYPSIDKLYYANGSGVGVAENRDAALELAVTDLIKSDTLMRFWVLGRNGVQLPETFVRQLLSEHKSGKERDVTYRRCLGPAVDALARKTFYVLPSPYAYVCVAVHSQLLWPCWSIGTAARLYPGQRASDYDNEEALLEALLEASVNCSANAALYSSAPRRTLAPDECRVSYDHGLYYSTFENTESMLNDNFSRTPGLFSECKEQYRAPEPPYVTWRNVRELYDRLHLSYYYFSNPEASYHVVRVLSYKLAPLSYNPKLFPISHHAFSSLLEDSWQHEHLGSDGVSPNFFTTIPHPFV